MMIWQIFGILFMAGGLGGVVNALMTDNGFILPKWEDADGNKIWRPGMVGNIFMGAVAAVISWGLYGPFAAYIIKGGPVGAPEPNLSVAALVGAALIGIAGSRWLSNEVDKKLLKATTASALAGAGSVGAAAKIMAATPAQALKLVQSMNRGSG
jgi:hypothetical protein